ncbi:dihydroxyacetone kinase subunit DhaL [Enterococcus casseliflavus]
MEQVTTEQTLEMLRYLAHELIRNEDRLCEIDRLIGDGDHGIGMAEGAKAILSTLDENKATTIDELFKKAGVAMINSMGGASGIIFGSFFLGLAKGTKNKESITVKELAIGMNQAVADIQKRGKATLGDKTMLDALIPAVEALNNCDSPDVIIALQEAKEKAVSGVEKTKEYSAKFGRSKFLGDRSIGYQDAGATSISIIFESMYAYLRNNREELWEE